MQLKIDKANILQTLEEFEWNPIKAYENHKVNEDMKNMDNGTFKQVPIAQAPSNTSAPEVADNNSESLGNSLKNVFKHREEVNKAVSEMHDGTGQELASNVVY